MTFSLINITESSGPLIFGYWLQDNIGSLSYALITWASGQLDYFSLFPIITTAEHSSVAEAVSFI